MPDGHADRDVAKLGLRGGRGVAEPEVGRARVGVEAAGGDEAEALTGSSERVGMLPNDGARPE